MAEWLRLQLGGGSIGGQRLLSDSVVEEMHSPQTVVRPSRDEEEMFPESHLDAYGLGWRLQDYRGRLIVRHGGALDGMRTHVALVPEEELGVVAITNISESAVPQAIVWYVIDQYLGRREKDWNRIYLAAAEKSRREAEEARTELEAERRAGTTPTHALQEFVGTYVSDLFDMATVELQHDTLVLRIGPSYVGDLEHWHVNTFRATWRDRYLGRAFVSFQLDRMGRVAAIDVQGFASFRRSAATGENEN
jgi:hypothetical protein